MQEGFPWFSPTTPARHWAAWEPAAASPDDEEEEAQGGCGRRKERRLGQEDRKYVVKKPGRDHSYAAASQLDDISRETSLALVSETSLTF